MAWFWRGAQSAFFYYVSCAPCTNYAFSRKRAKEAAKAEREAKRMLAEGTAPERAIGRGAFTTNIYWREEMMLGPHPKKGGKNNPGKDPLRTATGKYDTGDAKVNKKGKKRKREGPKTASEERDGRGLNTVGSASTAGGDGPQTSTSRPTSREVEQSTIAPLAASSGNEPSAPRTRYQRPDEALWGNPFPEKDWNYYARGRNPDLGPQCPPIASTLPATASEGAWMLQPPPPAKLMEGKQSPLALRPQTPDQSAGRARSQWSKLTAVSKRSSGTSISNLPQRPKKVLLCELGERMSDYHTPARPQTAREKKLLSPRIGRLDGMDESDEELDVDAEIEPEALDYRTDDEDAEADDVESSGPHTPQTFHTPGTSLESQRDARVDSALSLDLSSPSKNMSRDKRPPPIVTSPVRPAKARGRSERDVRGFDPTWAFPQRQVQVDQMSI